MQELEEWKDFPGHSGYKISSHGRIMGKKGGIRIPYAMPDRYYVITIEKKTYTVHRIVARMFIPNPNELPQVNHKDGNKLNNNVSNLEWSTGSDNIKHAYKTGLLKKYFRGEHPRAKGVTQYTMDGVMVREYDSLSSVKDFGFKLSSVSNCLYSGRKHSNGYVWKFS